MRFQTYNIFPTTLKRYDVSDIISAQDVRSTINDIDDIHHNRSDLIDHDELSVPIQSVPILFSPRFVYQEQAHWKKLSETFLLCCKNYIETVPNLSKNQLVLNQAGTRAWFYKSNNTVPRRGAGNPPHNHFPAFLSGVFYLQVPGDLSTGGTYFYDPRDSLCSPFYNEVVPVNLTWLIFPSWLNHTASIVDSTEWRYTIAADLYVTLSDNVTI